MNGQKKNIYNSLDGIRAYSAIGIVMMHVLANMQIKPDFGPVPTSVILWFTDFTLLFMMISAFSVCCGYYERIKNGRITSAEFYKKRYQRIWPFFALMVTIEFFVNPNLSTLYESFANLTLCFNLLPNPDISVIGVGWFVGTIFTFYMLFPFFTFLLNNKRRGWIVFFISLIFCYIAIGYFSQPAFVVEKIGRSNIIYSAPFFIVGGIVYLYRENIKNAFSNRYSISILFLISIASLVLKFSHISIGIDLFVIPDLIIFSTWLMLAITTQSAILNNRFAKYISGISMEIYLCHMMFYRALEMFGMQKFIADVNILYLVMVILTLAGSVVFSHVIKYGLFPIVTKLLKRS